MTRAMSRAKRAMLWLSVALFAVVIYVANFGLWPRYFDIEWDEEVLLHDGRMTVVHVRRTYERQGKRLARYPEYPLQVSMSFSFDTGQGRMFQHTFKRGTLYFLDEKLGKWYIGYHADPGDSSVEIGNTSIYPHVAILNQDGSINKPIDWDEIPLEITSANIMPATPNPSVVSIFHRKRLTVIEKMAHWRDYPTGAGWGTIHRITPQPITVGETK